MYMPTVELPDELTIAGEVFSTRSVNDMIQAYKFATDMVNELNVFRDECKIAITRMIDADTKTRRLIGDQLTAVVTMPGPHYNQTELKHIFRAHPLAPNYLRVERVAVKKREFDKLRNGSGSEELNNLKDMILACESESTRLPSVTIMENDK